MIEKPWLNHYDKGVPHTLKPYPRKTLLDEVSQTAGKEPGLTALHFKGASFSYGEIERQSGAFAAALSAMGIRKGDRVALLLPNSPQMIIAEFGIWKTGAIAVPVNPLYTEHELESALNECGAETVVVLTAFYSKIKSIFKGTALKRIIVSNIKDYLPSFKRLLFTLLKEKKDGHRITSDASDRSMSELIDTYSSTRPPVVSVGPDDPAVFLFSGGTTGKPKCAVSTHHALLISGMQIGAWFGVVLDTSEDIILLNMPLFHVYAQLGIMTAGLIKKHPLAIVPNPRDIDDLLTIIKTLRPAVLPGVPTLFNALINHPRVQKDTDLLKSLKLIVSGAAPLLLETKKRFEALTGGRIIDAYALTESMIASVCTPVHGVYKHGSVGIPAPDVDIRIVDHERGGEELPAGEIGEILMHAPQLMAGYWQNPEETAAILRDGWLHTGDLGYLDTDGYLFIVDRKKDVIKPGGFQVWPREVEEVLARHSSVSEVGVSGVPDDYQGEAVKAWVVIREGYETTVEELKAHCRTELAAYKVPRYIEFRQNLPKSMVGKVLRRKLVEEHCAESGVQAGFADR
jgi:long-chain acyl-CoA synthetase